MNWQVFIGRYKWVMAVALPIFAILFNIINFSEQYVASVAHFISFTGISILGFAVYFIVCRWITVLLKTRFPSKEQLYLRLCMAVLIFLIITALLLYVMLHLYDIFPWFDYVFNQTGFVWSLIWLGVLMIFFTFLMEGIEHYLDWKKNTSETEKIMAAYKQSQINGLKSQVNPHFLFNSLNSLSSLIQEDEHEAELFLNEMSKVYRYMLRNDDEMLVSMETELKFLSSYMHLLQARYGDGLQLHIDITPEHRKKMLAPLTLQVVLENAFNQNVVSKSSPLIIDITSDKDNCIAVSNNLQPKTVSGAIDFEAGLDSLMKKYDLLNNGIVVVETERKRTIRIPLFDHAKEVSV